MSTFAQQSSFGSLTLAGVLDDLAARFIVNLPPDELESMDRVCFQIEQAHWYYEDFIRPNASNPSALPSYNLKAFSLLMFKSCPLLHDLVPQHARIWTSFMQYKERVPVCGAVLINEWWDKVLLVKGWNKGSAWSFPRGKINKQEPEAMCAVREVLEETGFDLTPYFPPSQLHPSYIEPEGQERLPYYVELVIREQKIRLYFVPGIKESTRFATRTRKEISKIDWFRLSDLPTWDRDANHRKGKANSAVASRSKSEMANGKQAKFYMVTPFISHLKLWIDRNRPKNLPARTSNPNSPLPQPAYVAPDQGQRTAFMPGGRQLQPWSEDDSTNHLPSDGEGTEGDSTEDEVYGDWLDDGSEQVEQEWSMETARQGTDALQALFFGAGATNGNSHAPPAPDDSPLAPPPPPPPLHAFTVGHAPAEPIRPLPVPHQSSQLSTPNSTHSHATLHATPPQVAYERQQSFVQPKPKQSENHQTRLLELLTGSAQTPPPPQQPVTQQAMPHAAHDGTAVAMLERQAQLAGRMGNLALESPSPLAQQLPLPSHLPHPSYQHAHLHQPPHYDQRHAPAPAPSHSNLFSPASAQQPPPSAGGSQPAPVFVSDLEDSQKQEKRDALLRALLSVATKSPPRAPEREREDEAQEARWFASPPLQSRTQPPPQQQQQHAQAMSSQYQPVPPAPLPHLGGNGGGGSLLSILNGANAGPQPAATPFGHDGRFPSSSAPPPPPVHQYPASGAPTTSSVYPQSPSQPPYGVMPTMTPSMMNPLVPHPSRQAAHSVPHISAPPSSYAGPPYQNGYAPPPPSGPPQQFPSHSMPGPYPPSSAVPSQPQSYAMNHAVPLHSHPVPPMPGPGPPFTVQPGASQQSLPPSAAQQGRGNPGQLLGLLNGRG